MVLRFVDVFGREKDLRLSKLLQTFPRITSAQLAWYLRSVAG